MAPESAASFRQQISAKLKGCTSSVVLRVALGSGEVVEFAGRDLFDRALAMARQHSKAASGVVLLVLPHSVELFLLQIGLVLTGRIPAVLPWPTTRIDPEKYQRNLIHQLHRLPAAELLTLPALAANLQAVLPYPVSSCPVADSEKWEQVFSSRIDLDFDPHFSSGQAQSAQDLHDALFVQFSGGTTGMQKAVVITGEMMIAQMERLGQALEWNDRDGVVSWLPMYHDMGLIACLWLPLFVGAPSLHFAATDWLLNPGLLFEYLDRYRATMTWLPNFAFSYLATQHERIAGPHHLGHVRGWINCSEPVRLRSFSTFLQRFSKWGVRPESLASCYGMAENVFAISQSELGKFPKQFARSLTSNSTRIRDLAFDVPDETYVSSGKPLDDTKIRIVDASGTIYGDAVAGEIQLSTPSLFHGYWAHSSSAPFTEDGWFRTGDFGFLRDGELFVIGRLKDIIIVGGQNVFPEDVEALVNTVPGVYAGRVVVFGLPNESQDTQVLAIVAELRGEYQDDTARSLEKEIRSVVLASLGIAPRYVSVVPQRWILKSTAGKLARRETADRFIRERLAPRGVGSSSA